MRINKKILLTCFFFIFCITSIAQNIRGTVVVKKSNEPIIGGYVTLLRGDSIISVSQTNKEGGFSFNYHSNQECIIFVSSLDYQEVEFPFIPDSVSTPILLTLEESLMNVALDEVVVSTDRSHLIKRSANGQEFRLSEQARSLRNPFQALQEIPLLISDESSSTITMLNGKKPLILINGNQINSGVNPINPSDIESVEVINVVSARYLQEGYNGIVNIRLKKRTSPYVWFEAATRHDLPLNKGFGVLYFEVGNQHSSLYGRGTYNYTHHNDTENSIWRSNSTYKQLFQSIERTNENSWLGELLYKWSVTPKDYLAAHFYMKNSKTAIKEDGSGEYEESITIPYSFINSETNGSIILTSSIYYKHSFREKNDLEIRAAYNHSGNDLDSKRLEQWDEKVLNRYSIFSNSRNSGNVNIDYSKNFDSGYSMSLGLHTTAQFDKVNQISTSNPIFYHRKLNEYIFGAFGGKLKNLYYMASTGVEMIWLKAGDINNHYIRPRVSLSGTWSANPNNSLQLSYTLSNEIAQISMLNPYNTSTDSMFVTSGNPYLTPQMIHQFNLYYTFNSGGFYVMPSISYSRITDIIESKGFTENGIYHASYSNIGNFSMMLYTMNLSYRFKWGRISAEGGWKDSYYQGQSAQGSLFGSLNFTARAKKLTFNGSISFTSRDVYQVSTLNYYRPKMAQVQVNYNFTPDFYIALCLQDFTGELRTCTTTNDGTYYSITDKSYKDRNLRPWVLVRYTFRKNTHKKIKIGNNILNGEESGINIKNK